MVLATVNGRFFNPHAEIEKLLFGECQRAVAVLNVNCLLSARAADDLSISSHSINVLFVRKFAPDVKDQKSQRKPACTRRGAPGRIPRVRSAIY